MRRQIVLERYKIISKALSMNMSTGDARGTGILCVHHCVIVSLHKQSRKNKYNIAIIFFALAGGGFVFKDQDQPRFGKENTLHIYLIRDFCKLKIFCIFINAVYTGLIFSYVDQGQG